MKRILVILTLALVLAALFAGSAAAQSGDLLNPEAYRIQPGDTLSSIAREYCTTWQDVYRLNAGIIGTDPNALRVGTLIYVIDRCATNSVYDRGPRQHAMGTVSGSYYTVVAGDTLYSIGQRFGLNHTTIMEANGLTSTAVLTPGMQLYIPGLVAAPVTPAIAITSPPNGAFFRQPYTVQGTGQGLHENNVVVQLLDANGGLLAQQATTMQTGTVGGAGTWQVSFGAVYIPPNTNGRIQAFNPETGATATTWVLFAGY